MMMMMMMIATQIRLQAPTSGLLSQLVDGYFVSHTIRIFDFNRFNEWNRRQQMKLGESRFGETSSCIQYGDSHILCMIYSSKWVKCELPMWWHAFVNLNNCFQRSTECGLKFTPSNILISLMYFPLIIFKIRWWIFGMHHAQCTAMCVT